MFLRSHRAKQYIEQSGVYLITIMSSLAYPPPAWKARIFVRQ